MKLWHCVGARSLRALWALEELGFPYELELLPFPPRVFQRDFLDVNVLGTVPYFVDGEVSMTESCAIPHYLVTRHGGEHLGVAQDHPQYADFLNWTYHADATLTFPQHDRLREGKRRVRVIGPVQEVGVLRVILCHTEVLAAFPCGEVVRNGAGLGHRHLTIDKIRHGAEHVHVKEIALEHTRREWQQFQFVGEAKLLEGPEGAQGAGADTVPELHRPYWRAARSRMISSEPPPIAFTRTSR